MATSGKARGAKPKGPHGERVSRYPQLTIRIPPESKHQLEALSVLRALPMWRLLDDAIHGLVDALPAAERRLIVDMAARRARARPERS